MVLPATRSGGWIRRRYDSRVSSFSNRLVATLCLAASLLMTLSIVTTNSFEEDVMSNPVVVHLQKPSIGSLKGLGPLPLSMKRFASLDPLTPNGDDGDDDDDCEWMHAWQEETFSSCNNLHEIDMTRTDSSLTFINCGSSRCAVSYTDVLGKKLVMKVVKSKKEFTESTFRKARRDALSMERLTSSPYVSDIYGSCGVSHLTEYGTGGTIHDLIKLSRNGDSGFRELKPLTKLKIAYQLATAVADMHSFEPDQVASLAHMDICCHQFVLIRGVYKLNDFHLSTFIQKKRGHEQNEICPIVPYFSDSLIKLRAPEEVPSMYDPKTSVQVDKVDVYMLGNVLYYVHTNHWLYEGLSNEKAMSKIYQGEHSPYPGKIQTSGSPVVIALSKAIEMCWTRDWQSRPTARQVSDYLMSALRDHEVDVENVVRVTMPPLGKNHRFTDSDFYTNLDY